MQSKEKGKNSFSINKQSETLFKFTEKNCKKLTLKKFSDFQKSYEMKNQNQGVKIA